MQMFDPRSTHFLDMIFRGVFLIIFKFVKADMKTKISHSIEPQVVKVIQTCIAKPVRTKFGNSIRFDIGPGAFPAVNSR